MNFPYPYPLGLPKGTVRATLTLTLSFDLIYLMISGEQIASHLATIVVVALAFYFGGMMRATQPIATKIDSSQRAFGLPAGSIRLFLLILYGGTLTFVYYYKYTIPKYFLEIIYIIAGYIFGKIFNFITNHLFPRRTTGSVSIIDHLKALFAIVLTGITIYFTISEPNTNTTQLWVYIASILLGFYFSSREKQHQLENPQV